MSLQIEDSAGLIESVEHLVLSSNLTLQAKANGQGELEASGSGIGGSGTADKIPKFTATQTLADSIMSEVSGRILVGTDPGGQAGDKLRVGGPVTIKQAGETLQLRGGVTGNANIVNITFKDSAGTLDGQIGINSAGSRHLFYVTAAATSQQHNFQVWTGSAYSTQLEVQNGEIQVRQIDTIAAADLNIQRAGVTKMRVHATGVEITGQIRADTIRLDSAFSDCAFVQDTWEKYLEIVDGGGISRFIPVRNGTPTCT